MTDQLSPGDRVQTKDGKTGKVISIQRSLATVVLDDMSVVAVSTGSLVIIDDSTDSESQ